MAVAVSATGALVVGAESEAAPVTRGASVPFTTLEAEDAAHNGSVIGPDLTQGSLPSEASGRRAVTITSGQYVEWTLTGAANAVNVHYSVPDGRQGTLSVYVNGTKLDKRLNTTSQYSYIETPWIPGAKNHHFYDDDRMLLGSDLSAGDKVRVQVDSGDDAGQYTIDLADFEQVAAPTEQPSGSVSVTDHGAVANDGQDDVTGFRAAIDAAKATGAEVWIPRGEFTLGSSLQVDQVTIRGAGAWYSVLRSNNPFNNGGVSGGIELRDFAVMGAVTERNDSAPDNGFHGALGAGSVVSGLWLENLKCGLWLMNGATSNLTVVNNRILNMMADGVNFDGAVTDSVMDNNYLRNTGDDALATWSNGTPNARNAITNNTVVQPNLANGIAIYGGQGATVSGNVVQDTNALGGGILVANRFGSTPLTGEFVLENNMTIRAGALDPNWNFGVGALWFDARDTAISGATIRVSGFRAVDSPYEVFQFIDGNGAGKSITGVTIDGADVDGVGTFVVQAQTAGSVAISNVTATDVGAAGTYNCGGLQITGAGNSGWDTRWEGCDWP